ncbi:MAG: leucyl aminopeptidase [Acidobacteria bacterium]|nr:leucyl aminopeptidase [Acidobacteriota bacterium]
MNTSIQFQGLTTVPSGALVFAATEGAPPVTGIAAVDQWAAKLYTSGEFTGKPFELATLHNPAGIAAERAVLLGAGKPEKLDTVVARKLGGAAVRSLKAKLITTLAFIVDKTLQTAALVQALTEGAVAGDYEPDVHKTKKDSKHLDTFLLIAEGGSSDLAEASRNGAVIGEAQNFTRTLVNEPGNLLTPLKLAAAAKQMSEAQGLDCEILDEDRMRQLGMGSLLAVAQGSIEPPALIIVRYKPDQPVEGIHLGLIGKGVTFDTGGISIKPSENMEKMKYDMAGGAAVLGAMMAIAQLKPNVEVTALVPTVENMPSHNAVKPGDIVTSLAGKTVEILNTDAEGRLILIDAITYAKRLGINRMVDAATLTGAISIALGAVNVGAFSNNNDWQQQLLAAAATAGEKMWAMPMDDDYKDLLKSAFADMPNIGSRGAGSITAALFLQEWVEDTPWVHLDIAGTAWIDDNKPFLSKGPTGIAMRTFVELTRKLSN